MFTCCDIAAPIFSNKLNMKKQEIKKDLTSPKKNPKIGH